MSHMLVRKCTMIKCSTVYITSEIVHFTSFQMIGHIVQNVFFICCLLQVEMRTFQHPDGEISRGDVFPSCPCNQ